MKAACVHYSYTAKKLVNIYLAKGMRSTIYGARDGSTEELLHRNVLYILAPRGEASGATGLTGGWRARAWTCIHGLELEPGEEHARRYSRYCKPCHTYHVKASCIVGRPAEL